ncbi:hypothetical protein TNCV_610861 [Trichonephila clavipes]|nr:hypothetical protein TNCV_610861 [Trichonephila clavipes]
MYKLFVLFRIPKKFGDSCLLYKVELMELMTVHDNKEFDNDKFEGEVQLLTTDLLHKGLKFASSIEQQFLTHNPDLERALAFKFNLKDIKNYIKDLRNNNKKKTEADNNERNSSFESKLITVLDISIGDSNFDPVRN